MWGCADAQIRRCANARIDKRAHAHTHARACINTTTYACTMHAYALQHSHSAGAYALCAQRTFVHHANMQTYKHAPMQTCKHASMQACKQHICIRAYAHLRIRLSAQTRLLHASPEARTHARRCMVRICAHIRGHSTYADTCAGTHSTDNRRRADAQTCIPAVL